MINNWIIDVLAITISAQFTLYVRLEQRATNNVLQRDSIIKMRPAKMWWRREQKKEGEKKTLQ